MKNVETYRNPSKKWRDAISRRLIGQVCTSSQKFQDNLFERNAIPPSFLIELDKINKQFYGIVERYIYQQFCKKQKTVIEIHRYLKEDVQSFDIERLWEFFDRPQSGIQRSIDKVYEIISYTLFISVLKAVDARITVSVNPNKLEKSLILQEIVSILIGIRFEDPQYTVDAKVFRAGVVNAADTGMDMWANFGPVIQVKHINLREIDIEDIAEKTSADEIIIVCRDQDKKRIKALVRQLGAERRIRKIITRSDLTRWYSELFRKPPDETFCRTIFETLQREFKREFPFSNTFEAFYRERGYDGVPKPQNECPFWEDDDF